MKKVLTLLLVPAQIFIFTQTAQAFGTPEFPVCTDPSGEVIASYQEGTHGVPGDGTTYTGEDVVYKIDQDVLVQCLCPPNTTGIQTNWWRNPDLTENERKILINSGWVYVPNGALWGLDEVPYYAKNRPYNCHGRGGAVLGSTTSSSTGTSTGIGSVLGASTLAGTGTTKKILSSLLGGTAFLLIAKKIRPHSQS